MTRRNGDFCRRSTGFHLHTRHVLGSVLGLRPDRPRRPGHHLNRQRLTRTRPTSGSRFTTNCPPSFRGRRVGDGIERFGTLHRGLPHPHPRDVRVGRGGRRGLGPDWDHRVEDRGRKSPSRRGLSPAFPPRSRSPTLPFPYAHRNQYCPTSGRGPTGSGTPVCSSSA